MQGGMIYIRVLEGITFRFWHILCIAINICEFRTSCKSHFTNTLYSSPDGHGGQTAAIIESIIADRGHTVEDSNGGQASAIIECFKR